MTNIEKIKQMTAQELAEFLDRSGYVEFDNDNPYCHADCPDRSEDGHCPYYDEVAPCLNLTAKDQFVTWLEKDTGRLIEAQPQDDTHGEWIPCSEKMPEEHEWIGTKEFGTTISKEVYVTFERADGGRFTRHLSFQNGKLAPPDDWAITVFHNGAVPIAWKPLPEPYKGGGRKEDAE